MHSPSSAPPAGLVALTPCDPHTTSCAVCAQIRLLEGSAAGDRSAMDKASADARAEKERLAAELEAIRGELGQTRLVCAGGERRGGDGVMRFELLG